MKTIKVPAGILTDDRIPGTIRILMVYSSGPKTCWYSDERIAILTDLDRSDVRQYRKRLIAQSMLAPSGKGYRATIKNLTASASEALGASAKDEDPNAYPEVILDIKALEGTFSKPGMAVLKDLSVDSTREFWRYFDHHVNRVEALKALKDPEVAGYIALVAIGSIPDEHFLKLRDIGPGVGGMIRRLEISSDSMPSTSEKVRAKIPEWRAAGLLTVRELIAKGVDSDE